ncbi:MAG: 3-hexulose-6-phosphate synthase / 6-phospho-3-hexuloisomerase [Candidatus Methanomethylophilaceae archaeon]|nr:3-hexulose-6-phosphate synthase / 6-phospho-3-hexuloisomerase [Candidatus Methanomethylophilaceae archaeon]
MPPLVDGAGMKPVLQVALDLIHQKRALEIAAEAVKGGADWLEAGTPLIKSEGSEVIRTMRRRFPGVKIVADTKTMDVGAFEVEIAAKAGADIVTVMGLADDGTISEAVKTARRYGTDIMVDLMNVPDRIQRGKEAEAMGASYLCMHMGIDQQMRGGEPPYDVLRELSSEVGIPVAVAGGVSATTAPRLISCGAAIIIVGGAIIKADDVTAATRQLRKAMDEGMVIAVDFSRKYIEEELHIAFSKVSTCNIADAQHKYGVMRGIVPRIGHGTRVAGRAITVQTANGDWAKPVEAIDRADEGDIIVVDVGGGEIAVWGELATRSAINRGVKAVVIDGAVRDVDDIAELGFPVFSRHIAPDAGEPKGYGGIGHEIRVGGQVVRTGDWIIGDESGVIVVPKENAVEVANRALDVKERETRIREEIRRGSSLSIVNELERWEQVR